MQGPYVIMTRGFGNVVENGKIIGFELNMRIPYYRGTFLSLVHYLSLAVDGQPLPESQLRVLLGGRVFTIPQMKEADDVRWAYGAPATLRALKPGGLEPGLHEVEIGVVIRKSYFPPEDPEKLYGFFDLWKDGQYTPYIEAPLVISKRMTLVQ